jgi:hypothetical protein
MSATMMANLRPLQELEKIPLFMTKQPTAEQIAASPDLQAMQALIEAESTPKCTWCRPLAFQSARFSSAVIQRSASAQMSRTLCVQKRLADERTQACTATKLHNPTITHSKLHISLARRWLTVSAAPAPDVTTARAETAKVSGNMLFEAAKKSKEHSKVKKAEYLKAIAAYTEGIDEASSTFAQLHFFCAGGGGGGHGGGRGGGGRRRRLVCAVTAIATVGAACGAITACGGAGCFSRFEHSCQSTTKQHVETHPSSTALMPSVFCWMFCAGPVLPPSRYRSARTGSSTRCCTATERQ